jgi:hypothetical protein
MTVSITSPVYSFSTFLKIDAENCPEKVPVVLVRAGFQKAKGMPLMSMLIKMLLMWEIFPIHSKCLFSAW